MMLMHPDQHGAFEVASFLEESKARLNQDDFLAVSMDMANEQDKAVFEALTHNKEGFQAWRENMARTSMHMELSDYSALFEHHRSSLLDLAAEMNIPVQVNKISFDALLRKVDAEVSVRERRAPKGAAAFVEARVAVAALHQNAHLFQSRSNLHSLLVSDAIVYGVGTQIGEMLDWVVSKVKQYKCSWCKAVVASIIKGLCNVAGKAICTLLVGTLTGPLAPLGSKFLCDFPVYLSTLFTQWCTTGVNWLRNRLRLSDDCMCSFTIPSFTIPATDFTVAGVSVFKSAKKTIAIGQVCPTAAGQCAWSTDAQKQSYDVKKAADDAANAKLAAAEAERVKKMTKAEKIAYHTKIIKGEIKTAMSAALVKELLENVTGLGKSAVGAVVAGAKALATGDVKGAVTAAAKSVAKSVAETTVKSATKAAGTAVKNVAASAAKTATKIAVGAVTTTAINNVAKVAEKAVATGAANAGAKAETVLRTAGNTVVKGATAVVSATQGKEAAAAYNAKATANVDKAAAAVGKATTATAGVVGNLAVTLAKNSANGIVSAKVVKPLAQKVGDTVAGKTAATSTAAPAKTTPAKTAAAKTTTAKSTVVAKTAAAAKTAATTLSDAVKSATVSVANTAVTTATAKAAAAKAAVDKAAAEKKAEEDE